MLNNNIIIFILIFLVLFYQSYQINCLKKEHFDATASLDPNIKAAINAVYLADIEAIRNLSSIATKLVSNGGLTFTGNFDITGNSTISGNLTTKGTTTLVGNVNANTVAVSNFTADGNNFKVDANGNITCSAIKIGKWTIWDRNDGLGFSNNSIDFDPGNLNAGPSLKQFFCPDGDIWSVKSGAQLYSGTLPQYAKYSSEYGTSIKLGDGWIFNNGSMGFVLANGRWAQVESSGLMMANDAWNSHRKVADQ